MFYTRMYKEKISGEDVQNPTVCESEENLKLNSPTFLILNNYNVWVPKTIFIFNTLTKLTHGKA